MLDSIFGIVHCSVLAVRGIPAFSTTRVEMQLLSCSVRLLKHCQVVSCMFGLVCWRLSKEPLPVSRMSWSLNMAQATSSMFMEFLLFVASLWHKIVDQTV